MDLSWLRNSENNGNPGDLEAVEPPDPLLAAAKNHFGLSYLYPYQRLVIHNILEAAGDPESVRARQIVILPTGAGKSLCFSLPGVLLPGGTLIIYPLLGLMTDQARRFGQAKLGCAVLRGGQTKEERMDAWSKWESGKAKFLLTNPEALAQGSVQKKLKAFPPAHIVVDEAHTVVQWGETFRPAYADLGKILGELPTSLLTAFTATASPGVLARIGKSLFLNRSTHQVVGNPDRENLHYRVIPTLTPDAELERLLSPGSPGALPRPALVFCRSREAARLTAWELRCRLGEEEVFYYHAGLDRKEKQTVEEWFFQSNDGILAATCAYGMGIDKPGIRTVIHRSPPETVEAYLQEAGRGGRDRERAWAVLLSPLSGGSPRKRGADSESPQAPGAPLPNLAADPPECRRISLLGPLGADPRECTGCDVCDGSFQPIPRMGAAFLGYLRRHPRRFTRRQLRFLLAGRGSCEIEEEGLANAPGRGLLTPLSAQDVEALLEAAKLLRWIRFSSGVAGGRCASITPEGIKRIRLWNKAEPRIGWRVI